MWFSQVMHRIPWIPCRWRWHSHSWFENHCCAEVPYSQIIGEYLFFLRICWLLQSLCEELCFYCLSYDVPSQEGCALPLERCSTTQFHYCKKLSYSCTNSCVARLQVAFYHVHGRFCLNIGALVMQTEEGKRPYAIAYAWRVLTSAESKYHHLEAVAVAWAL